MSVETRMRTSVTSTEDPDDQDEFPGCSAVIEEDGSLSIIVVHDQTVETIYKPGEWTEVLVVAE